MREGQNQQSGRAVHSVGPAVRGRRRVVGVCQESPLRCGPLRAAGQAGRPRGRTTVSDKDK